MTIITIICFLSGISFSFCKETLHERLPQTIVDAEVFGMDMKYWSWAKKKPKVTNIDENKNVKNHTNRVVSIDDEINLSAVKIKENNQESF